MTYDRTGKTPLIRAIFIGDHEAFANLIAAGADVNVGDRHFGKTPLIWALINPFKELKDPVRTEKIFETLMEAVPDVNKADGWGSTPLTFVDNIDVLKRLIQMGANVNATDKNGQSVLMEVARKGSIKMVEELIKNGARLSPNDIQRINTSRMRKIIREILLQHIQSPLPEESQAKRQQRTAIQQDAQHQWRTKHWKTFKEQQPQQFQQHVKNGHRARDPPPPHLSLPMRLTQAQQRLASELGWDKDLQKTKCTSDYRKAALRLHPDRGGTTQQMKTLNSLYEKIKQQRGWN
jgi:hypothetical protein